MPTTIDPATAARLRASEPAILEALKAQATAGRETDTIVIPKADGSPFFSFQIQALSEPDYQRLVRKHSPPTLNRDTGLEVAGVTDMANYHADCIIEATLPEDQMLLWRNRELLQAYGVATSVQLVDKLLASGLKVQICNRIDELGRYGTTLPQVEQVTEALGKSSDPADG